MLSLDKNGHSYPGLAPQYTMCAIRQTEGSSADCALTRGCLYLCPERTAPSGCEVCTLTAYGGSHNSIFGWELIGLIVQDSMDGAQHE